MDWKIGLFVAILVLMLTVSPTAALVGDAVPDPPSGLEVDYDESSHAATLRWEAPADPGDFRYNGYRNGTLLASVGDTHYTDHLEPDQTLEEVHAIYFVTAIDEMTDQESLPTNPVIVSNLLPCELVIVVINPDRDPPASGHVNNACKERWERTINNLIEDAIDLVERAINPPGTGPIIGDNLVDR